MVNEHPAPVPPPPDPRIFHLRSFFAKYDCPQPYHEEDYIRAADRYDLDYRLLPAISLRESTCGRYFRLNNHWGWNSSNTGFDSIEEGINFVTAQLATQTPYRDQPIEQKLRYYNPRPAYTLEVLRFMNRIEPDRKLALLVALVRSALEKAATED